MKLGYLSGKETKQTTIPKPSLLKSQANKQPLSDPFKIHETNKTIFKNKEFRENQKEIILSSLSGNDIFVCMPTGGGKSLTFQLPAVLSSGITFVIMPLVSLIQDQVDHLNNLSISCKVLGAFKSNKLDKSFYQAVASDFSLKILFVTPEKLSKSDKVNTLLKSLYVNKRISRFVIDEAHCVSQ